MAHPRNRKKRHHRTRSDPRRAQAALQREEAKRREREQRRLEEEAEAKKAGRRKRLRSLAGPAAVGLAVFGAAFLLFRPGGDDPQALEPGVTVDYGTPTPVSGDYAAGDPRCGVFTEPVAPEAAVAALRVGAVVVWHAPDTAVAAQLATVASGYDSHLLVSPNGQITDPIVATAWDEAPAAFPAVDEALTAFIDEQRLGGPAEGACPMTGTRG